MKKTLLVAPLLFLAPLLLVAQQTEKVDLNTIHRIKEEALGRNSKVMDHLFYLTDVNGPRLQSSKGYRAAADWAVKRLTEYGLSNVRLEKWGPFGKGWNLELYSGHMLEPQYQPIIAMPVAWTAGTNGVVSGNPILVTPQTQAELDAFKGKLAGKIVMISAKRDLAMVTTPLGVRYSDAELQEIQTAQIQIPGLFGRGGRGGPAGTPGGRGGGGGGGGPRGGADLPQGGGAGRGGRDSGAGRRRHATGRRGAGSRRDGQPADAGDGGGALQPHRAADGARNPGEAAVRDQDQLRRRGAVQRDPGTSGQREKGRTGEGGRPLR